MPADSIRLAVAQQIDEMDDVDFMFALLVSGVLGLCAVGIAAAVVATVPYVSLAFFAISVVGFVAWRFAAALDTEAEPDPLGVLQEQYAAGELTDEKFEERLDALVDTTETGDEADSEVELDRIRR